MSKQKTGKSWSVVGRLKRAVKKINFLLSFNIRRWRLGLASVLRSASSSGRRRALSFNDRVGLHGFIEDVGSNENTTPVRALERVRSCASSDEDVDRRAEIFIANFRRQLLRERQVSLQLRYCRGDSF
ncbi:hypothetical protein Tsubulata_030863 [Turnera subulata]|uniref:DUF761 domain-containing protein n=1 Tax=Turnera subulata TaxID=218843 RepID=A0A9Q0FQU8_9ROSI|nr:hypothetical protein Tsubulata_030863 [Turnera subulata]